MRTKTLILSALCGLVGSAAAMAQVYSVNAVGYVNVTFKPGEFTMVANPLNGATNTLSTLFQGMPDGTQVFKYDHASNHYFIASFMAGADGGWDNDLTVAPGEGMFVQTPPDAGVIATNTFVGEVLQGNLTNSLPVGYSMVGSMVPQAGTADALGLTAGLPSGSQVFKYNPQTKMYDIWVYDTDMGWNGPNYTSDPPSLNVAESVFVSVTTASAWTRTFSVNN